MEKLQQILKGLSKNEEKVNSAMQEILALISKPKVQKVSNPDIVVGDVTYRWCIWSHSYHPLSEFVGGENKRNYSKAAHKIWTHFYKTAIKLKEQAAQELFSNEIDEVVFREKCQYAEEFGARKANPVEYEGVRGYSKEELLAKLS